MPPWVILLLAISGLVLVVALQAAGHTGRWRTVLEVSKTFGKYLLLLALPGIVAAVWLFIWTP